VSPNRKKEKQDRKRSKNSAKDEQGKGTSSKQKHRIVHLKENKREQKIKEVKSASAGENVATRSSSSSCCLTSEHCK
jgi:hypothetical protein